uniref:Uncharacterized protein n=1 Tax=Molossus molossus TaxID=27622 RepID=A0A7J8DBW5_MOLMO|nr:hypothetical protein HJG59_009348 [Molossus molossus]
MGPLPTLSLRACLPFSSLPLPVPCSSAPSLESPSCPGWSSGAPSKSQESSAWGGGGVQQRHGHSQPQLCDLRKVAQPLWASVIQQNRTEYTPRAPWLGKAVLAGLHARRRILTLTSAPLPPGAGASAIPLPVHVCNEVWPGGWTSSQWPAYSLICNISSGFSWEPFIPDLMFPDTCPR